MVLVQQKGDALLPCHPATLPPCSPPCSPAARQVLVQQKGELQLENAGLEERVQSLQEEMGVMHDEKEALLDR